MRHLATIERIKKIESIPNADKIELATVRDWKVVVRKDDFKEKDYIVFYEIDSFLPVKQEYEFLLKGSKIKKLLIDGEEKEGIRLKSTKLRGQLSQGLIMPINLVLSADGTYEEDQDVSEELGVFKYEPPIPACISGIVKGNFPSFIPKTDEERIQNCGDLLEMIKGCDCYITSKLDGTSATFYKYKGEFGACSRNLELKDGDNIFWKLAKEYNLMEKLPEGFAVQGEIVGPGIQNNPLKLSKSDIYIYNIFDIKNQQYLNFDNMVSTVRGLGLKTVPVINDNFIINHTVEELLEMANGKSPINDKVLQEGIVIRPLVERNETINRIITRLSFKVISNEYLLKVEQ